MKEHSASKKGRIAKSFNNSIFSICGQLLRAVFSFAVRTVFIMFLGKTYLGLNGLFTNIISVLSLAELGIGVAIVFQMYSTVANDYREKTKQYLYFYKIVYRYIGLIVLVIGLVLMPFLKHFIRDDINGINIYFIYIFYLANVVSSYFLFAYRNAIVIANQEEYKLWWINYLSAVITGVLQIIFLFLFKSIYLYLIVPVAVNILLSVARGIIIGRLYPFIIEKPKERLAEEEIGNVRKNVYSLLLYRISNVILTSTDNIILASFVGLVIVGIYSNYLLIIGTITTILSGVFSSLTASVGNLNALERADKKYEIFKTITFINFWLYGFCAICCYVLFTPFIKLWIGESFLLIPLAEIVIIINFMILGFQQTIYIHRTAAGLFYQGRYRPVMSAIINIVVSIILVKWLGGISPDMGLVGSLLGSILSILVANWWFDAWIIHKHVFYISPKPYYIKYWKRFIFICILGVAIKYLCSFYNFGELLNLIAMIVTCALIVNGVFFVLFRKSSEFIYLKNATMHFIKRQ